MKKTLLAALIAASALPALAAEYYVVVPLSKPTLESTKNISVALNSVALPGALAGLEYAGFDFNQALQVTGDPKFDSRSVSWRVAGGALPAGLALSADGKLSGTPTVAGPSSFQLQAIYKTKAGKQSYQLLVGEIHVGLASAALPGAVEGLEYAYDFRPRLSITGDLGNQGAVVWRVIEGALPAGLVLSADGRVYGTPTSPGTANFKLQASYKTTSGVQSYQVVVGAITVGLATASLPAGLQGSAYYYDFKRHLTVTGNPQFDMSSVTWSAPTSLPQGLQLNSDGTLSGTPAAGGQANVEIQARYLGKAASRVYALAIQALAPDLRLAGAPETSHNFGTAPAGSSATAKNILVTNVGNAPGSLTIPAFGGTNPSDFSATNTCNNVAPAGNCQVTVSFRPAQTGIRSATLSVAGTTFTFTGTGQPAPTQYVVLTSGSSYQIPAGVSTLTAWAIGGGGGGAGSYAEDGNAGGGGGAGGVTYSTFAVVSGQTLTYTIGAGGAGGYGMAGGNQGGATAVNYGTVKLQAYGGTGGYHNAGINAAGGSWAGGIGGSQGGVGIGSRSDSGGGGGGAIGGVSGASPGSAGGTGGTATYPGGLDAALIAAGRTLGSPGQGASQGSYATANATTGGTATGFGHGGGGAGYYGGHGGSAAYGGGGGGAAGYSAEQVGGNGGQGFVVLKLN